MSLGNSDQTKTNGSSGSSLTTTGSTHQQKILVVDKFEKRPNVSVAISKKNFFFHLTVIRVSHPTSKLGASFGQEKGLAISILGAMSIKFTQQVG